jgi:hypothetical protein
MPNSRRTLLATVLVAVTLALTAGAANAQTQNDGWGGGGCVQSYTDPDGAGSNLSPGGGFASEVWSAIFLGFGSRLGIVSPRFLPAPPTGEWAHSQPATTAPRVTLSALPVRRTR